MNIVLAIAAAFLVAAVVIFLIPDRFKPWWERSRGLGDRDSED